MGPSAKFHFGSFLYCAGLASLNHFRSVRYSRTVGLQWEDYSPCSLAYLISIALVVLLAFRCLRLVRRRLEEGEKVGRGKWIPYPLVVCFALPLLWHNESTSRWVEPDGAIATATGGYGSSLSNAVFVYAVAGMLLFQIFIRLSFWGDGGAVVHRPLGVDVA